MANSQEENRYTHPLDFPFEAFDALVNKRGRRGIRIFGLPREQLIMATIAALLFLVPVAFLVGMFPFWDNVAKFSPLKQLNAYLAPEVDGLSFEYRGDAAPRFPVKRFLIASASMVEVVFLSNFVALFVRGVRRHALLVWVCYDRTKLLQYFGISAFVFCVLWYVLFVDWTILAVLIDLGLRSRSRMLGMILYAAVMSMPFVALVFGHIASIIVLGSLRTALRKLRVRNAAW